MNKPNVAKLVSNIKLSVSRHSPEILTGLGIAGMISTTILAVKATPKALKLIEERKKEEDLDKLPPVEIIKTTWKCYIPTITTGVTSIACIIGASSVNAKRNAALATAYKLSEAAFSEYREKVIETIGEKKEQAVKEKIDRDHIEKNPVSRSEVIITEKGNTLCYDSISKRYFKSDIERIRKVENDLNRDMLCDIFGYVSLNDFYDEIGLNRMDIADDLGWNVSTGLIKIDFGTQMADNNTPCVVLNYVVAPKYGYSKFS